MTAFGVGHFFALCIWGRSIIDPIGDDDEAKLLNRVLVEFGLLQLQVHACRTNGNQDVYIRVSVFLNIITVNHDAVQVGCTETIKIRFHCVIEEVLRVSGGVDRSERHGWRFEPSGSDSEYWLVFLPLGYPDEFGNSSHVKQSEYLCIWEVH